MRKVGLVIFGLILSAFVSGQSIYADSNDITLVINGKKISLEQNIIIQNGRVLVPYSLIAKNLGAVSSWDSSSKKVTVKVNGKLIEIKIGNKTAMINGEPTELDVPPMIRNDRTMIPLRFVAESLDYNVDYDKYERVVSLTLNATGVGNESLVSFEEISYDSKEYKFLEEYFLARRTQSYSNSVNKDGYTYVIADYGTKNTGGYDVKVESISFNDGKYYVKTGLHAPAPGSVVTTALTYPKIIVRFKNQQKLPVIVDMQEDNLTDLSTKIS